MADEFYREEIIFSVDDEEAIRRTKDMESRMERFHKKQEKRTKALSKMKASPLFEVRDRMSQQITKADSLIKKLDKAKATPVISVKDKASAVIEKTNKMMEALEKNDIDVFFEMKGDLADEILKTKSALKDLDGRKIKGFAEIKGNLLDDLTSAQKMMSKIGNESVEPTASLRDRATSKAKSILQRLSNLTSKTWEITIAVKDRTFAVFQSMMNNLTNPIAMLGGTALATGSVVVPLKLAGDMEKAGLSMEFFTESAERGLKMMEDLKTFAATTPFEFPFLRETATSLVGMYKAMTNDIEGSIDSTFRTIRAFGDAAGYTGVGEEGMKLALLGFRQIGTVGKLNLEELRQVTENLLIPMELVRKELGLTKEEMGDIGNMNIEAPRAMEAILKALENNFGGGMEKFAKTLHGLVSNIKDTARFAVTAFGEGMATPVKDILLDIVGTTDYTSDEFQKFTDKLKGYGKEIGEFFKGNYFKIKDIVISPEFQEADLTGKIKIVWAEVVSKPFEKWYNGGGKDQVGEVAEKIGGDIGSMLGASLMALAGVKVTGEDQSPFVNAGATAADSFINGFSENFDLMAIISKAAQSLLNMNASMFESPGSFIGTLIADAIILALTAKLLSFMGGPLGGLLKGGKWIADKVTGGKRKKTTKNDDSSKPAIGSRTDKKNKKKKPPGGNDGDGGAAAVVTKPNKKTKDTTKTASDTTEPSVGSRTDKKTSGWLGKLPGKNVLKKVPILGSLLGIGGIVAANGPKEKAKETGGFLGGAAGGWGGAAAGAALGSVVPGVGTAIGGIVGGIAGSIGGDSLGRWLGGKATDIGKFFNFSSAEKKVERFNGDFDNQIKDIPKTASSNLSGLGGKFGGWFSSASTSGVSGISALPRGVGGVLGGITGASALALGGLSPLFFGQMNSASASGVSGVSGLPSGVGSVLGGVSGASALALGGLSPLFFGQMNSASASGVSGMSGLPGGVGGILGGIPGASLGILGMLSPLFFGQMNSASTSGVSGLSGLPLGVGGILGGIPGVSLGILGMLAPLFFGQTSSAKTSAISGMNGLPSGIAGIISSIAPSASSVFGGLLTTFASWGTKLGNAVRTAFGQGKSTADSLERSGGKNVKVDGSHATGLQKVPFDGYIAELHKDEAVLTAAEARIYRKQGLFNKNKPNTTLDLFGGSEATTGVKPYDDGGYVGYSVPDYQVPPSYSANETQSSSGGIQLNVDMENMVGDIVIQNAGELDDKLEEIAALFVKRLKAIFANKV